MRLFLSVKYFSLFLSIFILVVLFVWMSFEMGEL